MEYSIKDLERISGIKAHTLRIWEKRYEILTPQRTDTNIRSYDHDDLRKLLNINTLIKNGWKISKIGKLSNEELGNEVQQQFDEITSDTQDTTPYVNALVIAMLDFNEQAFEKIFSIVTTRIGLKNTMIRVINPFLQRVGLMWSVWKVHPGHEHFATNIIRKKLFSAIDLLMPQVQKNSEFILFLPSGEDHEIGLLFANYLLRAEGHETVYLGQNVPFDALQQVVEKRKPNALLTFFVLNTKSEKVQSCLDQYAKHFKSQKIYVAGSPEIFSGLNILPSVKLLLSPESLDEVING